MFVSSCRIREYPILTSPRPEAEFETVDVLTWAKVHGDRVLGLIPVRLDPKLVRAWVEPRDAEQALGPAQQRTRLHRDALWPLSFEELKLERAGHGVGYDPSR